MTERPLNRHHIAASCNQAGRIEVPHGVEMYTRRSASRRVFCHHESTVLGGMGRSSAVKNSQPATPVPILSI